MAVAAGIVGVSKWPLYFLHVSDFYPGLSHARLMAYGFFGGFILGFLGTALPRMLSTSPFTLPEAAVLLALYVAMCASYSLSKIVAGDVLLLVILGFFLVCAAVRFARRKDTPPPAFLLVGLGLACAAAGAVLAILDANADEARWPVLQHLLSYQGFVLFPILGVGAFVLPRFFGLPNPQDLPEAKRPNRAWWGRAWPALAVAVAIIVSFFLEAGKWHRLGPALRFVAVLAYVGFELPLFQVSPVKNAFGIALRGAFAMLLAGFAITAIFPEYRISLLHLTLIGGFAVVTFAVGTRVILGHSGHLKLMAQRNRWFLVVAGFLWFAMATRISGDFVPKIKASHYVYGAFVWIIAVVIWAYRVLGKVLIKDPDD